MGAHSDRCGRDGAVHAIGNGEFLIYGKGPDLGPIFGPDYTSPSFGTIETDAGFVVQAARESGSNCWRHTLRQDGFKNVFTDGMDPERNVFVRKIAAEFPCALRYRRTSGVRTYVRPEYGVSGRKVECAVHIMAPGTPCFLTDVLRTEHRMVFLAEGCARLSPDGETVEILPGEGTLTIVVAKTPELDETLAFALSGQDVEIRDEAFWRAFLARGARVRESVPDDHPECARIRAALESAAIGIKAQKSRSGGVMAGHFYPMAYVRDQSGVLRGLLRMGYPDEARDILAFWYAKWRIYGNLYNAESMGNEDARLMFSNDEVEVPAYVVFCAFEYLAVTEEATFVESIFDMLAWALAVQLKHLKHGMTGFSGDETYIAGHIFPRPFLYHGSAESTLLFIEGAKRALAFDAPRGLLGDARARIAEAVEEAEALYRENFVSSGVLYGNNPARERYDIPPRYHFGFCQLEELEGVPAKLTWVERGPDGVYRCPDCLGKPARLPCASDKRFLLGSVNLLPAYYHTTVFTREELAENARPYTDAFERTGYVSSDIEGDRSLGYDFGLFLYNMAYLGTGLEERALSLALDMIDSRGMWAEYYKNGVPYNCRCRPWESAINIEAILYAVGRAAKGSV